MLVSPLPDRRCWFVEPDRYRYSKRRSRPTADDRAADRFSIGREEKNRWRKATEKSDRSRSSSPDVSDDHREDSRRLFTLVND